MQKLLSSIDFKLFLPACFLVILGGMILVSVSPSSFPTQFLYLGLALLTFLFFSKVDFRVWLAIAPWFYGLALGILGFTLFLGELSRGATRWIEIGGISIQTSEVAKPLLLIFFAWFLTRNSNLSRFSLSIPLVAIAVFFILAQPDLGSALVVLAGFSGSILIAGLPLVFIVIFFIGGGIALPFLWHFLADYQKQRIETFLSPTADPLGTGYNAIQAVIAVGSGQLNGRGLGQGTQSQLAFLPERHTDFIFAALSEELGFVGSFLTILTFTLLLWHLVSLLRIAEEDCEKVFLGGAFLTIFFQAAVNIGMNLGLLPITGIPLPFVSSGGSSLLSMSMILGICSSISRDLFSRRNLGII